MGWQQVGVVDEDHVWIFARWGDGEALGPKPKRAAAAFEMTKRGGLAEAGWGDEEYVSAAVREQAERRLRRFRHHLRIPHRDVSGHQVS